MSDKDTETEHANASPLAREFWIFPEANSFIGTIQKKEITDFSGWGDSLKPELQIHVIEYSAYEALRAENVDLRKELSTPDVRIQELENQLEKIAKWFKNEGLDFDAELEDIK